VRNAIEEVRPVRASPAPLEEGRVIEADGHSAAFRQAMSQLPPAHYDKPIRLEQQARGGARQRK
jgi:hypothetical protein